MIDVDQVKGSPQSDAVGRVAQRLNATVVAGIVEDAGLDHFANAALAWNPDGTIAARYDKVHRVPYGEYIPFRGLVKHLANLDAVPRDALAGHGDSVLSTAAGRLGVAISYEVFFSDRARIAVRHGAQVMLVPTNASSFSTGQVPAQELAAARLRAMETGRWVVQAAPTGYSGIVDPGGTYTRTPPVTVIEAYGSTSLVQVGDNYFLYPVGGSSWPMLKYANGTPVVARRSESLAIFRGSSRAAFSR